MIPNQGISLHTQLGSVSVMELTVTAGHLLLSAFLKETIPETNLCQSSQ